MSCDPDTRTDDLCEYQYEDTPLCEYCLSRAAEREYWTRYFSGMPRSEFRTDEENRQDIIDAGRGHLVLP